MKWLLVCLRQESCSSAMVGRVNPIAFPFCVQLSTVCMPSQCPNPPSPRLPRRVPRISFQSSLSSQSSRHLKTSLNKLDQCTLEGESSTFTFPPKTSNRLKHKPTLLSVYHIHFFLLPFSSHHFLLLGGYGRKKMDQEWVKPCPSLTFINHESWLTNLTILISGYEQRLGCQTNLGSNPGSAVFEQKESD